MRFVSRYISHIPNDVGIINYSASEHDIWRQLYNRQMAILPNRACDEFMVGLKMLDLSATSIPQLPDVSRKLHALTGWQVQSVAALISAREFFELLATKRFPAATFIRTQEQLDYVQEPDIFHELFGHCPLLTNPVYADFLCNYARYVLATPEKEWPLLQRFFWFTVEFGLIQTTQGLRIYGGGILSSISETAYSVESDVPLRILFAPVSIFRTPYRIDQLQAIYFVINDFQVLYDFVRHGANNYIQRACELKEFPPFFTVDANNPNIHILAC
jgi:phenylalanine-4-hydroxylase